MELVLEQVEYKDLLKNVSYKFSSKKVTGLYGDNCNYLMDLISGDILDYDGDIYLDDVLLEKSFYRKNSTAIAIIDSKPFFYSNKVDEEFKFNTSFRKYDCDLEKREKTILGIVGLDESILDRNINTLSSSEKYLLSIAINLIYDPKIIMFKDVFWGLDRNNKKKIMTIIKNLKEDDKIVIISHRDTNILYELVDEVILMDKENIYACGDSDELFTSSEIIKDKIVPIPYISEVTYLAKNKKVKLSYHKDVRDIIKDIYKHV